MREDGLAAEEESKLSKNISYIYTKSKVVLRKWISFTFHHKTEKYPQGLFPRAQFYLTHVIACGIKKTGTIDWKI